MKRKQRVFAFLLVVLIFVFHFQIFADNAMYSTGIQPSLNPFLFPTTSVDVTSVFGDSSASLSLYPTIPLVYEDTYSCSDSFSSYFADDDLTSEAAFEGFVNYSDFDISSLLTVDEGYVSLNYNCSSSVVFATDNFTDIVFSAHDFYSWTDGTFDSSSGKNAEVGFTVDQVGLDSSDPILYNYCDITYSVLGSDSILTYRVPWGEDRFLNGSFDCDPSLWLSNSAPGQIFYIHSFDVHCHLRNPATYFEYSGILFYEYVPELRALDLEAAKPFDDENPAIPLLDYTSWMGTAVSGFLDLQIFPKFTLGGILMTLVAFSCVVWFLKMFAGG